MTLVLKVLCSECGAKIGEAHRDGYGGFNWRPIWQTGRGTATPSGADSISRPRFWCLQHGYTDASEIEAATGRVVDGKVTTHRASMRT